jgi:hypothetical protein
LTVSGHSARNAAHFSLRRALTAARCVRVRPRPCPLPLARLSRAADAGAVL